MQNTAHKKNLKLHTLLQLIKDEALISRLTQKDSQLWSKDQGVQQKICHRLGWLNADDFLNQNIQTCIDFALRAKNDGFTDYVWIGMGGSSLFANMLADVFQSTHFHIIDTTDTQYIDHCLKTLNIKTTLFFIASKSGTTLETLSVFNHLKNIIPKHNFVALSDANTPLLEEFVNHSSDYYHHFINPTDVGGRFSSLTYFGLVPMALISSKDLRNNVKTFLQSYKTDTFKHSVELITAHIMTAYQNKHANKLILHLPPTFEYFSHWVEQLVAESTGKHEKGFIPLPSASILNDREDYIHITHTHISEKIPLPDSLENPLSLNKHALLLHSYLWMHITALLGHFLNFNPFDEPNVTQSKELTKKILDHEIIDLKTSDIHELDLHLQSLRSKKSDFIALLFYGNFSQKNLYNLQKLQENFSKSSQTPCVIYPGPQYLHSVGQYFKGGKNDGHYIILVEEPQSVLKGNKKHLNNIKLAQAKGDYQALQDQKRSCFIFSSKVIFNHLNTFNHDR